MVVVRARRSAKRRRSLLAAVGAAAVLAACGPAPAPTGQPGLSTTSVDLGAIVTQSGPLAPSFAPYLEGVRAYLDFVNRELHGVHGRALRLTAALDDGSLPSLNLTSAKRLVSGHGVFAIVGVATAFFTAASYLGHTSMPTFGFATQDVWAGPSNLFAAYGSRVTYSTIVPEVAFVAARRHATRAALIAYGYPPSAAPCAALRDGLSGYGVHVVYANLNETIGANFIGIDVAKLRAAHADLVVSCMDVAGNVALARDMGNVGLGHVGEVWFDGYDRALLRRNAAQYAATTLILQQVPFEAAAAYPRAFPGLTRYLESMARFGFSGQRYSAVALTGWEGAHLLVQALEAVGPNPTQRAVLDALNRITDDTGGGVAPPTDWTVAHDPDAPVGVACAAYVTAQGGGPDARFVMTYHTGANPWVCFPGSGTADLAHPVPPPAGAPGA